MYTEPPGCLLVDSNETEINDISLKITMIEQNSDEANTLNAYFNNEGAHSGEYEEQEKDQKTLEHAQYSLDERHGKEEEKRQMNEIKNEQIKNSDLHKDEFNKMHKWNKNIIERTKKVRIVLYITLVIIPFSIFSILNISRSDEDDIPYEIPLFIIILIPVISLLFLHINSVKDYGEFKYKDLLNGTNAHNKLCIFQRSLTCNKYQEYVTNKGGKENFKKEVIEYIKKENDLYKTLKDNGFYIIDKFDSGLYKYPPGEKITCASILKTCLMFDYYKHSDNHIVNSCCCKNYGKQCWNLLCCLFCCTSKDNSIYIIE